MTALREVTWVSLIDAAIERAMLYRDFLPNAEHRTLEDQAGSHGRSSAELIDELNAFCARGRDEAVALLDRRRGSVGALNLLFDATQNDLSMLARRLGRYGQYGVQAALDALQGEYRRASCRREFTAAEASVRDKA